MQFFFIEGSPYWINLIQLDETNGDELFVSFIYFWLSKVDKTSEQESLDVIWFFSCVFENDFVKNATYWDLCYGVQVMRDFAKVEKMKSSVKIWCLFGQYSEDDIERQFLCLSTIRRRQRSLRDHWRRFSSTWNETGYKVCMSVYLNQKMATFGMTLINYFLTFQPTNLNDILIYDKLYSAQSTSISCLHLKPSL